MTRKIIAFLLIITMFLVAGCEPETPKPTSNPTAENNSSTKVVTTEQPNSEQAKNNFVFYTISGDGTTLVAQNSPASKLSTVDNVHIINYLLKNDQLFDKNASVKTIEIKDGLATANFNKDFKKIKVGGSNNELLIVGSIVNTLVANDAHIKKVQLLIEGKVVETLLGHVDISEPLEKMPDLIKQ